MIPTGAFWHRSERDVHVIRHASLHMGLLGTSGGEVGCV